MPRIVISVSDGQKALWVEAAHDERVNLSEWVRRACDGRAVGEALLPRVPSVPENRRVVGRPPRSFVEREFKPDFKGKGK